MIDTSTWKEFVLDDLFYISRGQRHVVRNHIKGDLPYYSASLDNNGVTDYIGNPLFTDNDAIVVTTFGDAFYAKGQFTASDEITILHHKDTTELSGLFIASVIHSNKWKYSFKVKAFKERVSADSIKLPATSDGQPDWEYMETYMKQIMEESEKSLENLKKANGKKHSIDVSCWGEFKLSDLFTKRTMKGYPKKVESYDDVENGYHIYGQNIGWQYPYKVLMDEQYLHKVQPDKPILAYASSIGEIGLINESFYRSGNNGAFQGLFPIGYHPNLLQMQFLLAILKKKFEAFRYDTSMQNTMNITFKLPITTAGEPDWQYMEDYMKSIMDQSEKVIECLNAYRKGKE